MTKMSEEALARLERMILPVVLEVESVESTWKLAQNKTEAARLGAADGMTDETPGAGVAELAQLMRHPPEAS
jgi:transcriptional regulator